jgi:hypothetical protein
MIEAALDRCIASDCQDHPERDRPAQALFRQLLSYLATGQPPQPDAVMPYRRHASRFGDALRAVLRDMVGTEGSPDLPLRCVDAFWDCLRLAARSTSQARPANITVNS